MNPFISLIKTRRSIRRYTDRQVSDEQLAQILEAGTYAPTSRGMQRPFIVAIQNEEWRNRLSRMNSAFATHKDTDQFYNAPTQIYVFAPADYEMHVQDCSCILQNMMLAAHALSLGSCWINRCIQMFATPEGREEMRLMQLPEGLVGVGALAVGHAVAIPTSTKPRKADYTRIFK